MSKEHADDALAMDNDDHDISLAAEIAHDLNEPKNSNSDERSKESENKQAKAVEDISDILPQPQLSGDCDDQKAEEVDDEEDEEVDDEVPVATPILPHLDENEETGVSTPPQQIELDDNKSLSRGNTKEAPPPQG